MNETVHNLIIFALVGFFAQLIDGSLGMGYKVSSTTFLLSFGIPPVLASASVHTAGVFTSATSGLAHFKFGNIQRDLIVRLAIPGVIGGVIGALTLTSLPTAIIKPLVAAYLMVMGIVILRKARKQSTDLHITRRIVPLGLIGGFFDAIGGGGWGPIVTGTLVADGRQPRFVIGSVNTAEFFVTLVQAAAFLTLLGEARWEAVIGLIVGGVPAAAMSAYISKHLPAQKLMLFIGIVIIILSLRTLYLALTT
jgi:uncharacterized membrane protein YfcA